MLCSLDHEVSWISCVGAFVYNWMRNSFPELLARKQEYFSTFHLLWLCFVCKTPTIMYFSFPQWSTLMTLWLRLQSSVVILAVSVTEGIFIALHFSTSCAKCIAVIAFGCLPQKLFTPCIAMLAYCSPKIGYSLPPQYLWSRRIQRLITCRSVGYQVKSDTVLHPNMHRWLQGELTSELELPTCLGSMGSVPFPRPAPLIMLLSLVCYGLSP